MKKSLWMGAFATLVFIGCGGSNEPTSSGTATITGVAVDDVIVNGAVSVMPAEERSRILQTARTDENGSYTISVDYEGLVIVEVRCDESAYMLNPATGERTACGDLVLHSAAEAARDRNVTVAVTPLSEAVVRHMGDAPTSESFNAARQTIAAMFGVDPIGDLPTGDSPAARTYSGVIDAIHTLADDSNLSIKQVVETLAEDLSDGTAGDDSNLTIGLARVMKREENLSNALANHLGEGNATAYTPPENLPVDKISEAKAFFQELRTQAIGLFGDPRNGNRGFIDMEGERIARGLEETTLNVNYIANAITKFSKAIEWMSKNELNSYTPQLPNGFMGTGKTISWTVDESGFHYTIEGGYGGTFMLPAGIDEFNLSTFQSPLNARIEGSLPPLGEDVAAQAFGANLQLTRSGSNVTMNLDANVSSGDETIAITQLSGRLHTTEGEMDYQEPERLHLVASKGDFGFDGDLMLSNYVTNATADVEGHHIPGRMQFAGTLIDRNNGSSLLGTVDLQLRNAAAIDFSASNSHPDFSVSVGGRLVLPTSSHLDLSIGVSKSGDEHNATLNYTHGATVVNGTARLQENGKEGTIDFTSGNGLNIHIVLANDDIDTQNSSIKKDGEVIGRFEQRNGVTVIKYLDETFESLY